MPGGKNLPESEADPLTIDLIGRIWDAEIPDLVVFAGGQLYACTTAPGQWCWWKVDCPVQKIPHVNNR